MAFGFGKTSGALGGSASGGAVNTGPDLDTIQTEVCILHYTHIHANFDFADLEPTGSWISLHRRRRQSSPYHVLGPSTRADVVAS